MPSADTKATDLKISRRNYAHLCTFGHRGKLGICILDDMMMCGEIMFFTEYFFVQTVWFGLNIRTFFINYNLKLANNLMNPKEHMVFTVKDVIVTILQRTEVPPEVQGDYLFFTVGLQNLTIM